MFIRLFCCFLWHCLVCWVCCVKILSGWLSWWAVVLDLLLCWVLCCLADLLLFSVEYVCFGV